MAPYALSRYNSLSLEQRGTYKHKYKEANFHKCSPALACNFTEKRT